MSWKENNKAIDFYFLFFRIKNTILRRQSISTLVSVHLTLHIKNIPNLIQSNEFKIVFESGDGRKENNNERLMVLYIENKIDKY